MFARLEVLGGDGEDGGDVEEAGAGNALEGCAAETLATGDKTIVTRRSKQHKNRRLKNGRQVSAQWRRWAGEVKSVSVLLHKRGTSRILKQFVRDTECFFSLYHAKIKC